MGFYLPIMATLALGVFRTDCQAAQPGIAESAPKEEGRKEAWKE